MKVQENRTWVIYALKCPDTFAVRYVGWTVDLPNRIAAHKAKAKSEIHKTHCQKWISSLLAAGKEFIVEVLQQGSGAWAETEKQWIAHYRQLDANLCNHTDGGDGTLGYSLTVEQRKKLSNSHKGKKRTEEWKKLMSEKMKGRQFSEEWKRKISEAKKKNNWMKGKHHTKEEIENVRQKLLGRKRPFLKRGSPSKETRRKISIANKTFFALHPGFHSGSRNHNYGKHLTDETKAKLSLSRRGHITRESEQA